MNRRKISAVVLGAFFLLLAPVTIGFALLQMAKHDVERDIFPPDKSIGTATPTAYFRYWKCRFDSSSLLEIDFDVTDQVDAAGSPEFLDPHDESAKVTWGLFGPWRHSNMILK